MPKRKTAVEPDLLETIGSGRYSFRETFLNRPTQVYVKGKKTKKERKRIRKRYESLKEEKPDKKLEVGRALRYMGRNVRR